MPFPPLVALREELLRRDLTVFLVPRADEHQGEYIPPSAQRLTWLTGFTGSAGLGVVATQWAAVLVDGRYTLQVRQEIDTSAFEPVDLPANDSAAWLGKRLTALDRVGFDPWLHTRDQVRALRTACEAVGATLIACESNPLDAVWADRPAPPCGPVVLHEAAHAGRSRAEKRNDLAQILLRENLEVAVSSDPASIAWLLNVRGHDVEYTPLPLSFGLFHQDGRVEWFIAAAKVSGEIRDVLGPDVLIRDPQTLLGTLDGLTGKRVRIDPAQAPLAIVERLRQANAKIVWGPDPCLLPKACKNAVEQNGARAAHRRDGAALVRFLAWLEGREDVDECLAAERLEAFRQENALFQGLSFPTIAGAGPNGAIVHYRASIQSNRRLAPGDVFLLDSGAQYLDGTTDVTRTLFIAGAEGRISPSAEQRRRFTLVLKGHIALAQAVFPEETSGSQLDVLARQALWRQGLDYAHGTGHGVGSYLSVHEGPQRISKSGSANVSLRPGMILSNEPGSYKAGAYGIRIENLMLVVEAEKPVEAELSLLTFEPLTLVPIDQRLIDPSLLEPQERTWLDAYHARVWNEISPLVEGAARLWLEGATAPFSP